MRYEVYSIYTSQYEKKEKPVYSPIVDKLPKPPTSSPLVKLGLNDKLVYGDLNRLDYFLLLPPTFSTVTVVEPIHFLEIMDILTKPEQHVGARACHIVYLYKPEKRKITSPLERLVSVYIVQYMAWNPHMMFRPVCRIW